MKKNKINILGVCGSIRSGYKKIRKLEEWVKKSNNAKELNQYIKNSKNSFSNSDISVAHAMLGAISTGAEIKMISINNIFEKKHTNLFNKTIDSNYKDMEEIDALHVNNKQLEGLMMDVHNSHGVVLGTPVYFGDRSSVANKFLQLTNSRQSLKGKAFGVVSVGAKRNGGQETANIYSLSEGLIQDCVVVGNGPDTVQYGGTLVGGDKGAVLNDISGLKTAYGTGLKVAKLASILHIGKESNNINVVIKITVIVTMDTLKGKYLKIVKEYFKNEAMEGRGVEFTFLNLVGHTIYRCVACDVCPSPRHRQKHKDQKSPYNCIVQVKTDEMKNIQKDLNSSDATILVGVNTHDDLIYRYQAFMERTRYIRRENFELTNRVIFGMLINNVGSFNNPLHNLKVLTSFIRHNMFVVKSIEVMRHEEKIIYQDSIKNQIEIIRQIKSGRNQTNYDKICYKATGYVNRELDHTVKSRR